MRRLTLSLLLLAALLGGCRKETPAPPPAAAKPAPAPAQTGPVDGGRLVRRLTNDLNTLNYILQQSEEERLVLAYLYDPLIEFDRNANPIPGLATKWEIADGGKTYVLHLDRRATFSDKRPVRASDVVFTLNKMAEESTQFGGWFAGLDRAHTKAVDDHTVRVAFNEPHVTQLMYFNIGVMPEHIYGKGDLSKNRKVIGAGPYTLISREVGRSIVMRRRADYWREKPHIDTVVFRVIADDKVAFNALKRGEVDVAYIENDTWWFGKDDPAIKKDIEFHTVYAPSSNCILWNLKRPLLNDVRVRRALAMSFDRQAVIERLYHGEARPVTGPFTPDQWANNPNVPPIEYNLQGASALLLSAGWRDTNGDRTLDRGKETFSFTLAIPSGVRTAVDQSQILQASLKELGVQMEIETLEPTTFFERVFGGNYDAAFVSWVNEPDPDPHSLFHSSQLPPNGNNVVGYVNPEVDALIERGRREFDRQRRTEIYQQLHEILARDQPYLWTVQVAWKWGVNRRVHNVKTAPGFGLFMWRPGPYEWWVTK
jgi:peptide/nickel transport system substrate-binding protein